MIPAILMGYNERKFKQFNNLIKDKTFVNKLILNVAQIISLLKNKQNSIILNYDDVLITYLNGITYSRKSGKV